MNKSVLKARYGSELRKNWIHHNNDVSLNDLVTKMQRYFDIKDGSTIKLKYRDEESDWITLTNDDDLAFALGSMDLLFIDVLNDNHLDSSEENDTCNAVREDVDSEVRSQKSQPQQQPPMQPTPTQQQQLNGVQQFTEIPLSGGGGSPPMGMGTPMPVAVGPPPPMPMQQYATEINPPPIHQQQPPPNQFTDFHQQQKQLGYAPPPLPSSVPAAQQQLYNDYQRQTPQLGSVPPLPPSAGQPAQQIGYAPPPLMQQYTTDINPPPVHQQHPTHQVTDYHQQQKQLGYGPPPPQPPVSAPGAVGGIPPPPQGYATMGQQMVPNPFSKYYKP